LAAAAENCLAFECMVYDNPLRQRLLSEPVGDPATMTEGRLPIPNGPGLGVVIDRDALASYRIEG
jgi:galactonate dehydratase